MSQMDHIKGRAWAEGVYEEKLANPKSLPNLGAGYSNALRAARAVQSIADRKLFTRPRGIRFDDPDSTTPSTARFTWRSASTIKALSATDKVITVPVGSEPLLLVPSWLQ